VKLKVSTLISASCPGRHEAGVAVGNRGLHVEVALERHHHEQGLRGRDHPPMACTAPRRRQARSWCRLGASLRAHLRERPVLARQVEPLPDIDQRLGKRVGHAVVVTG
jgi:hypothetical protein